MNNITKTKFSAAVTAAAVCLTFGGCGNSGKNGGKTKTSAVTSAVSYDAQVHEIAAEDKDVGYSEDESVMVNLLDGEAEITGGGAEFKDGRLSITEAGTYILSGELAGQIYVKAKGCEVRLVLDGVNVTNGTHSALLVEKAEKVTLTLAEGSENYLSDGEKYTLTDTDDNADGAVFSRADLTINGEGSLSVSGNYKHGIVGKDNVVIAGGNVSVSAVSTAVSGKDSVKIGGGIVDLSAGTNGIHATNADEDGKGIISISGGTLAVTSAGDALQAEKDIVVTGGEISAVTGGGSENAQMKNDFGGWGGNPQSAGSDTDTVSAKGLKAGGGIQLSGGNINIDSSDDSVHSDSAVAIDGGTLSAKSGDDGIHADGELVISDGIVKILKSYEGIEGKNITVSGGEVEITASDDGVNSSGGSDTGSEERVGRDGFMQGDSDCNLTFSGGKTTVNADGDGIDSNGNIYVTGGEVYVSGPTNGGNGAIDYGEQGCVCEISGGIVVAAGAVGMEVGFGENSAQYSVLHNFSAQTSGEFTVTDGGGNALIKFTPEKNYQSVVFSCPELREGSCTLAAGELSEEVEITSIVTSNSSGMGGGFGRGGGGKFGGGMPDGGDFGGGMPGGTPPDIPDGGGEFQNGEMPV